MRFPVQRGDRSGRSDVVAVACLAALAAALYLPRLLPSSGYSPDTMKYHYLGAVLGISHAPGSPLYILINWIVAQLPIGELAWRLNLLSAVAAAAAASFLYLAARELTGARLPAMCGAAALLTAAVFWEQSIVAEVYTLHAVFLLASTWRLLRWHRTGSRPDLGTAALLYGLSFGIHLMSWYFLPGWIALAMAGPRSIVGRRRETALVAAGALAGMGTYLYYVIRPAMSPLYVEVQIDGVGGFFDYITGGDFKRRMFAYDLPTMAGERLVWLWDLATVNAGLPLIAVALVGVAVVARRSPRLLVAVAAPIVLGSFYAMGYAVGDARIFALPALYMLMASAAVGLHAAASRGAALVGRPWVSTATLVVLVALIGLERSGQVARNAAVLDRSDDRRWAQYATRILTDVERGATIVAGSDWIFHALAYQHWGRGLRANGRLYLQTAEPEGCDATRRAVDLYLARGPVYGTTGVTSCLEEAYTLETWDLSRTLPDYLAALPEGRLVAFAMHDEAVAGIDEGAWGALGRLGVLSGLRGRAGWSYAAALVRTRDGFAGTERTSEREAAIDLARGTPIAEGADAPMPIAIRSGGTASGRSASIVADGTEYAEPRRGLHVVVFDRATGAALDRRVFDTHRTTSLREFSFFRVTPKVGQPSESGAVPSPDRGSVVPD